MTITDIRAEIAAQLPTNTSGLITAPVLRTVLNDILTYTDSLHVWLEDYGGVGDSTTDNVAAWNAAVTALGPAVNATSNVTIRLDPTKGYAFNSSITIPKGWTVDGQVGSVRPIRWGESWNSSKAYARGWFMFRANATNGDTFTLGTRTITLVSGAPAANQVQIGANLQATQTAVLAFLQASTDPQIVQCSYTGGYYTSAQLTASDFATTEIATIEITYGTVGTAGNTFVLATHSQNALTTFQSGGVPPASQTLGSATNSSFLRNGGAATVGGTMIMKNSSTVNYSIGCAVQNLNIVNGDIQSVIAGPVRHIEIINTFAGTGLTALPASGESSVSDFLFSNLMIIGFDKAIRGIGANKCTVRRIRHDCTNGLEFSSMFDLGDISDIRANSYFVGGYNSSDLLVGDITYRSGYHVHVRDGASECRITDCFAFGFALPFLGGWELELMWDKCSFDGPSAVTTKRVLDINLSARGSGYANNTSGTSTNTIATCTPSKGEQLFVTTIGGVINGVTVLDAGTWDGSETPPTVAITSASGSGAVAVATFVRSAGFQSYGTIDRFTYTSPASDASPGYGAKLVGVNGTHYLNAPIFNTPTVADVSAGVNTTVIHAGGRVGTKNAILGRIGQAQVFIRSGTPEANVTAAPGSIYLRTDGGGGTSFYIKETGTGNTGWVTVATSTSLHNSFNVMDYGAKGDGTTDDSAAFIAVINAMNALHATGVPAIVTIPAGIFRIVSSLPIFVGGGFVYGQGALKSIILVDTAYSGDVFSWTESWQGAAGTVWGPNTPTFSTNKMGAGIIGVGIFGTLASSNTQNALMFYDRNDRVVVRDIQVEFMPGQAFACGLRKNVIAGAGGCYMRESSIEDVKIYSCGKGTTTPIMEVSTAAEANDDSTNEIYFANINIYSPFGPGLWIRNGNTASPVRFLRFYNLRIEGQLSPSPAISGDLLTIGDGTFTGTISDLTFYGVQLIQPYTGFSGLTIKAPNNAAGNNIYTITFQGLQFGPGPGKGLNILAGRAIRYEIYDISVSGTGITVGPAANGVGSPHILASDYNLQASWSYSIDGTSTGLLFKPSIVAGWP